MGTVLILLFALLAFALAALRWGYTSVDGPESQEWARRERSGWRDGQTRISASGAGQKRWRNVAGCANIECGGGRGSLCS